MINVQNGDILSLFLKTISNGFKGSVIFLNHEEWNLKWGCIKVDSLILEDGTIKKIDNYDLFFNMSEIVYFSIEEKSLQKTVEHKSISDKARLNELLELKKERDLIERKSIKDFLTKDQSEFKPVKYEMPSFKKRT